MFEDHVGLDKGKNPQPLLIKNLGRRIPYNPLLGSTKLLRASVLFGSLLYRFQARTNVHFLHIRKTGGSAIKEALKNIYETPAGYTLWLHRHKTKLSHIPPGDKVVIFIRDPIDRFVSGFYSRKRQGRPKYYNPWNSIEELAFKLFDTPNELAKSLSSKDKERRTFAFKAMRGIRHVNTYIKDWVISKDYLLARQEDILFIGCQEYLVNDFEILKKLLGIPPKVTKLPEDPIKSHKSPLNVDKHLSPEAVKNLLEWYRGDYEIYRTLLNIRARILRNMGEKVKACEKLKRWKKIAQKA